MMANVRTAAGPDVRSIRGQQDHAFFHRALHVIGHGRRFAWLGMATKVTALDPGLRRAVLSELGRVQSRELMRRMAERVCRLKPATARQAVAVVRHWRLRGMEGESYPFDLAGRINGAIREFTGGLPAVGADDVVAALDLVAEQYPRDPGEEERRAARLAAERAELVAAVGVLMDGPRATPSRLAAAAVVLVVPVMTELARVRQRTGKVAKAGKVGTAAGEAGKLFNVSCRYVADALRLRNADLLAFAAVLGGTLTLQQAKRHDHGENE